MNRLLAFFACGMALAACTDTTGLSPVSSRGPRGNLQAAVVVWEFADLQCPACRAAHPAIVQPLIAQYSNQIRFDHKHFPLRSIHRYALDAAEAAECAADQGKFWEFMDYAFEHQPDLKEDVLSEWAETVGVEDMDLFERCLASDIKRDTILEDYEEGRELGVSGTPTFLVDGQKVETKLESISAAIDEALGGMMQRL